MQSSDERFLSEDFSDLNCDDETRSNSSVGSLSKHQRMAAANARQQENLVTHGKQVRDIYMRFNCGTISVKQLREELSNLEIQETHVLTRLLNQGDGSSLKYTEFLLSLKYIDEEDLKNLREFRKPVKPTEHSATPFATVQDVLNGRDQDNSVEPSSDILTWSTPDKNRTTPSRKKATKTSFTESPIPIFEPGEYQPPEVEEEGETLPPFTPKDRNALIQAYLGQSINKEEFLNQLETRCGITPSENLNLLINSHEGGKTVRFLDMCKEITTLLEKKNFTKIVVPRRAASTVKATIDIYDMEHAKEEKRASIPHSKEQIDSKRKQRNLFTWEDTEKESILPSRKLGVGAYKGTNDLFDRTPEQPKIKPSLRSAKNATAESNSGDIFGWSTPPKVNEEIKPGKKASTNSPVRISAIPWGTEEDCLKSHDNPHAHYMAKRNRDYNF